MSKEIKNIIDISKAVDKEIRLNFDSVAELARKLGTTRQHLRLVLKKISNENNQIPFNTVLKILNGVGYKIIIKKD